MDGNPARFFLDHIAQTSPNPLVLEVDRAEGVYIYSTGGKRFTDLVSGIGVNNIGHGHPRVLQAIEEQTKAHLHVMAYGEFVQKSQNDLAERILSLLPASLDCCFFVNSGAEANEGALKLARRYTGRPGIVACRRSYHGSTMGSMSVSGNEERKGAFRPLVPGVRFIDFNNTDDVASISGDTACVIMETVQGDAGVIAPTPAFIRAVRARCDAVGALLILDEIQCGMGRTGTLFAFEQFEVVPDIITVGKAFGGGLPLGAFIANSAMMKTLTHDPMLGHITTFGGNPVSCAAGKATLDVIVREDVLANVASKGNRFRSALGHPAIRGIRQRGLMIAIDLEAPEMADRVVRTALEEGIILFRFLSNPQSVRISPPLTITNDEIDESCLALERVLNRTTP